MARVYVLGCLAQGFQLVMVAGRRVEEGEELTHSYVDPLDPILVKT